MTRHFLLVVSVGVLAAAAQPETGSRLTGAVAAPPAGSPAIRLANSRKVDFARLPLQFEKNLGQTDAGVGFLARAQQHIVFLKSDEAIFALLSGIEGASSSKSDPHHPMPRRASLLHMRLVGADRSAPMEGVEALPGVSNYFLGQDSSRWRTEVPGFGRVRTRNVWKGIDLEYYGNGANLVEHDFVVAPGADPRCIRLAFSGHSRMELDEATGVLRLETAEGVVEFQKPIAYQMAAAGRRDVESRFVTGERDSVSFALGAYDPSLPLIIDPVLAYSTFVGGSSSEFARGIAVNSSGEAYVTGYTYSVDLPVTSAAQSAFIAGPDVFVAKLNAAGTAIVYATYAGGSGTDVPEDIAIDSTGAAYVTGYTYSKDFPLQGALQPIPGSSDGNADAFVFKLTAAGNQFAYSTFLGGSSWDAGYAITVDSSGSAYVVGETDSSTNFPTVANSFQTTAGGGREGFIAKLNAGGSALVYSSYIGGANTDSAYGVAVNASGEAFVTGYTCSPGLATAGVVQTANNACDAFVMRVAADGQSRLYFTYYGGEGRDAAYDIALDVNNNAYIVGGTDSSTLPLANPLQAARASLLFEDAFIAKIGPTGTNLALSTYFGGNSWDRAQSVFVDAAGNIWVAGNTLSSNLNTVNPLQTRSSALGYPVFRSVNAGGNWSAASGVAATATLGFAFDLTSPSTMYTLDSYNVFRSTDSGANWNPIDTSTVPGMRQALAVAPSSGQVIYLGTNGGVYKTIDGGSNWSQAASGATSVSIQALAVHPTNPNVAYAGTAVGILKTVDGTNWTVANVGLRTTDVRALAIHASNPQVIYAGTTGGLFKSFDGGTTWVALTTAPAESIAISPSDPNVVYAVSGDVYRSGDAGLTWARINTSMKRYWLAGVAVDPFNSSVVYTGAPERGVYKTTDAGATWALLTSGVDRAYVQSVAVSPINSNNLYAAVAVQSDAFVAKITPTYTLGFSTYLGASGWDEAFGIAAGGSGIAYVVGTTASATFPVTQGASRTTPRGVDVFVAKICETGAPCVSSNSFYADQTVFPSVGGASLAKVIVPGGTPWTVTGAPDWIQIEQPPQVGPGGFYFTVLDNASVTRTATLSVGAATINITQAGPDSCTYMLTANSSNFLAGGDSGTIVLVTQPGCPWQVMNSMPWVSVSPSGSGSGMTTFTITAAANPNPGGRSGSINFGTAIFSVTQAGNCAYVLQPTVMQSFGENGGTGSISVYTAAGCPWQASTSASWLLLTGARSGIGSGTVAYTVQANTTPTIRSGFVSAGGRSVAISVAASTTVVPDLTIAKTHTGNFTQGQTGATYTITVGNSGLAPTSGLVTVTESLPAGLTATSMLGTNWICTQPAGPCTRSDALAVGSSYPAITVTVNVSASAAASVTNIANVSGGGELNTANDQASDPTTIAAATVVTTTIWPASAVPGTPWHADGPATLGLKFSSDVSGSITGIRFYKGAGNSGTHIGALYSSAGVLLAQATFTGETASGWQQVSFSTPVSIAAKTTYVAAFFSNSGFAFDAGYFMSKGVDNAPLHALRYGVDGPNGVYMYGSPLQFPSNDGGGANYWIDPVFAASTPGTPVISTIFAPSAVPGTPWHSDGPVTLGLKFRSDVSGTVTGIRFYKGAGNNGTHIGALYSSAGALLAQATFTGETASGWQQVSFSTPVSIAASTTYVAAFFSNSGFAFDAGYFMSKGVDNAPLHALRYGVDGPNGVYMYGSPLQFPSNDGGGGNYWIDPVFATSAVVPPATSTIFAPSAVPGTPWHSDGPVTLGLKFRSDVSGSVTGIRFYKGAGNNGTHIGALYSSAGALLAQATFTGETASGWQQVSFSTPVPIAANTTYVAALYSNSGFAFDAGYFMSKGVDNAPLHALRYGVDGPNGQYLYGSSLQFPSNDGGGGNYWVDVVFQ